MAQSPKRPTRRPTKKQKQQNTTIIVVSVVIIVILVALFIVLWKTGTLDSILKNQSSSPTYTADKTSENEESGKDKSGSEESTSSGEQSGSKSAVRAASVGEIDGEPIYIHFVYVGQGDAILLDLPNDEYMLIDAGSTKKPPESKISAKNIFLNYLKDVVKTGVINYMIVTHPDQDHVSFMTDVLNAYEVKNIFYNYLDNTTKEAPSDLYKTFIETARKEEGANVVEIDTPENSTRKFNVGECKFTVFSPGNDGFTSQKARIMNGMSLITLMEYGDRKMLFTGDATSEEEAWFIEYTSEYDMDVDFLKIAHHGSETSNTTAFLTYVKAEYGVICAGEANSYGLPASGALGRIEAANVTYYRTDYNGTIVLTIDSDGDFSFVFEREKTDETDKTGSTDETEATDETEVTD